VTRLALPLIGLAMVVAASLPASAQHDLSPPQNPVTAGGPRTTIFAGGGIAENQYAFVPAVHVGARRLLIGQDSVTLLDAYGHSIGVERMELLLEGQWMRSSGGSRCEVLSGAGCWRTEHLLSTGLAVRTSVTPNRFPLQLQFFPATANVHLSQRRIMDRGEPTPGAPFGVFTPGERVTSVGFGLGNGLALRARIAGREGVLELRPTLIRFSDGRRGGIIPISAGVSF
jgi:hypothetical protein